MCARGVVAGWAREAGDLQSGFVGDQPYRRAEGHSGSGLDAAIVGGGRPIDRAHGSAEQEVNQGGAQLMVIPGDGAPSALGRVVGAILGLVLFATLRARLGFAGCGEGTAGESLRDVHGQRARETASGSRKHASDDAVHAGLTQNLRVRRQYR